VLSVGEWRGLLTGRQDTRRRVRQGLLSAVPDPVGGGRVGPRGEAPGRRPPGGRSIVPVLCRRTALPLPVLSGSAGTLRGENENILYKERETLSTDSFLIWKFAVGLNSCLPRTTDRSAYQPNQWTVANGKLIYPPCIWVDTPTKTDSETAWNG